MANISKTGIVTSSGKVNPNLLSRYVSPGGNRPDNHASAGKTLYYGDYGIIIPAQENADTYFSLYMKETLTLNSTYTLSCIASGLLDGSYYYFPLFTQGNSSMGLFKINQNGLCHLTFTMTYTNTQTAYTVGTETVYRCFMDDSGRSISTGQGNITLTNFKLEIGSVPTPWIPCDTDPNFIINDSSFFEVDDICKIYKSGYIQANEFIEI